ncbi:MAG: hypothetical protein Q8O87_03605 [bacterium]|nr:hypothetical protein [bacterium]
MKKAQKRIALVARDAAPSGAFQRLASELQARGKDPVTFLGNGAPIGVAPTEIVNHLSECDFVLFGMSSSADLAREELTVAEAANDLNLPFGFYKDIVEGSSIRAHFNHDWLKSGASLLFVRNEEEAVYMRDMLPNATVVASGNPLVEDAFFPRLDRRGVRNAFGIGQDERVIFCTGTKLAFENFYCFVAVLNAVDQLGKAYSQDRFRVIFSMHPGDPNLKYVYDSDNILVRGEYNDEELMQSGVYRDLFNYSSVPAMLVTKQRMSSTDILPGVDLVINTGSTIAESAACLRLPVIDFLGGQLALNRYARLGLPDYPFANSRAGVSLWAHAESLYPLICEFANSLGDSRRLRSRQEEIYPRPQERGQAIRIMADALQAI